MTSANLCGANIRESPSKNLSNISFSQITSYFYFEISSHISEDIIVLIVQISTED